ncbi:kelch-like 24 [Orbilia oligospora]|uniref:Kelch-like 24 n=1 Tax=Orbilia oligospora TaxID=2813651 RepID=A0A7C8U9C6_ORBOL|nr:kelch-like 24 [Orbilia oligospora]
MSIPSELDSLYNFEDDIYSTPPLRKRRRTNSHRVDSSNACSELARKKLMQILYDRENSDVTVTVGPKNKEYYLHRVVICPSSAFFKTALKPERFKEGYTGKVNLPEMKPDTFDVIARYMYSAELTVTPAYGDNIIDIYEGAGFLQIPELQEAIFKTLTEFLSTHMKDLRKSQRKELLSFFIKFCDCCSKSDLGKLARCAEFLFVEFDMTPEDFLTEFETKEPGYLFMAAVMAAGQNLRHTN